MHYDLPSFCRLLGSCQRIAFLYEPIDYFLDHLELTISSLIVQGEADFTNKKLTLIEGLNENLLAF